MKKFIIFGMFSCYSIIPLILPFFCYLNNVFYISVFHKDYYKGKMFIPSTFIYNNHIIFCMFIESISLILSGILEFISSLRLKNVLINENLNNNTFLIYNYEKKLHSSKIIYALIFTAVFLDFFFSIVCLSIASNINSKAINSNNLLLMLRYVQLISTALLCYFLINFKFHRHHYLGLICVLIGTTFEYVFDLRKENFLTFSDCIFCLGYVLFSLGQVIEKIIIESKFISPFKLLFYKGICYTIVNIIAYFILVLIRCDNNFLNNYYCTSKYVEPINITKIFKDISSITTILLYILITWILNILAILTNYYFNPNYRVTSDSFTDVLNSLYFLIVFDINYYKWYVIVGNVILIFGILIFNEIIVLNFWDISRYTKYEIYIRGNLERISIDDQKDDENL